MRFRALIAGVGLVAVALVSGMVALRQRLSSQLDAPSTRGLVEAPAAGPRGGARWQGWLGVLIAEESVDVAARQDGRVESVKVQVGVMVRQGDALVQMDARDLREELAIAEAELLSLRAELEVTLLAHARAEERLKRRDSPEQLRLMAISEEEISTARYEARMELAKSDVARAKVQEQEVRVAQLRQKVAESTLRAPFDGVVAGRFVHPSSLVKAGAPLVHLLRQGKLQVRFARPAHEPGALQVGQVVRVDVAERGLTLRGRVTQVAPEVDVATRMVFALADLERPEDSSALMGTAVRVSPTSDSPRAESP
ncbi:RND family efflux transporter, MFP subunit [Myxococcus fulvus]|uniref:RND family efflux transporter, MFP subunit n=1 Tax=Myxococcus fulvus TaxID=33 RepID=A0A511T4J3_MYXFU|nr:efflux RND transporter periplasmic adaptor subunit [Myxococcus fulvus]AKF86440.1 hypothetical protein MFUL124B02_26900 [Myxococcus fulvus 124B02]GEN09080.1 hypothetical protein MFU01_41170 [Myxococcus fulvus]SEU15182.1 RND family efflux transporter, MFP subunit [Myxococcus fulvus]